MSKLKILIFGTNQYYEHPQDLMNSFIETHTVENLVKKHDSTMEFTYSLTSNDPTTIKLIFLKNLERGYNFCQGADANIIFIDLECVDALDKLNNIIEYIKENISQEIKSYVIGKYNSTEDKIKSLNINTMTEHLKNKDFLFQYDEICTEPKKEFDDNIENFFKQILESKFKMSQNRAIQRQSDNRDDQSNSGCIIF